MSAIIEAINSAGRVFTAFSVPMLIQSSLLVVILFAADLLLRRKLRAVFRYWIWTLVLVKLVLPVSLWSPVSVGTWFGQTLTAPLESRESEPRPVASQLRTEDRAQKTAPPSDIGPLISDQDRVAAAKPALSESRTGDRLPMGTSDTDRHTAVEQSANVAPFVPVATAKPTPSLSWQGLAFLIWAAVAVALSLLLLQRAVFVKGLAARTDSAPAELAASLEECRRRMAVGQPIRLRISPYATSPAVCGLVRPTILIPQGLAAKLQAHELRAVLMHELAHVKRGDLWVNVTQTLLQIVYFYNPLVWLANAMIRRVREQAVDETVLVAMGDTADEYPQTLVNIARLALATRPALTLRLIGVVESKSALTARIKHILTHPTPKSAKLGLLGLLAVVVMGAFVLPMAKGDGFGWSERNVLIRFTPEDKGHGFSGTVGDRRVYARDYTVSFRKGEKLAIVAELYQVGQPMRVLGCKIFPDPGRPQRLSATLTMHDLNSDRTAIEHSLEITLGGKSLRVTGVRVNTPEFFNNWDGSFLPVSEIAKKRRDGKTYMEFTNLLTLRVCPDGGRQRVPWLWMPGYNFAWEANNAYFILVRMLSLSQLDILQVNTPFEGGQLPDGTYLPDNASVEQRQAVADEYLLNIRRLLMRERMPLKGLMAQSSVVNNGPLDIRLVGVCPDQSDDILNANGEKIDTMLYSEAGEPTWTSDIRHRDFIFELPETNEPIMFSYSQVLNVAGEDTPLHYLSRDSRLFPEVVRGRRVVVVDTFLPKTYRTSVWGLFTREMAVDRVDIVLKYFYGPSRKTLVSFTGPFVEGQVLMAPQISGVKLTVLPERIEGPPGGRRAYFRLDLPFKMDPRTSILMYDTEGKRYLTWARSTTTYNGATTIEFCDYQQAYVPLTGVSRITLEEPHALVVKNVRVSYADRPPLDHAPYLDTMAERLGLTGMSPEQLRQYQIKSPEEAVKVIDIIRGDWFMSNALEVLRNARPLVRISDMNEASQERIHRAATAWAESGHMGVYGLDLGLMGKWPEFFDKAVERLKHGFPARQYSPEYEETWLQCDRKIADTMRRYWSEPNAVEIEKLKECILAATDSRVLGDLIMCLGTTKSSETTDAFWELAQDDRPWVWWRATEIWYARASPEARSYDSLPESMKIRVLLVTGSGGIPADADVKTKASALVAGMLTPELAQMASDVWSSVNVRVSRQFDKKMVTEIYIGYLRRLQTLMAEHEWKDPIVSGNANDVVVIMRALNLWYNVNLGNLGASYKAEESFKYEPRTLTALQGLVSEALKWHDANLDLSPRELPLEGRVVDTAGHPIADAQLSFTRFEDYRTPSGASAQRRLNVGACRTDAEGRFTLSGLGNDTVHVVDVNAAGFMPRRQLSVYRSPDGRYQLESNNIVVMQRTGTISGRILGIEGASSQRDRLTLFLSNRYSLEGRRNLAIDSEGRFTAENVSQGPGLLSYVERRQVLDAQTFRVEYAGHCAALLFQAEEGGHLNDLVLDLSKSVCSLEVTVVDAAGQPVKAITFYLDVAMPSGPYRDATIFGTREAASDGVYRFDGLPPGAWRARVAEQQFGYKTVDVVLLPQEIARCRMVLGSPQDEPSKVPDVSNRAAAESNRTNR